MGTRLEHFEKVEPAMASEHAALLKDSVTDFVTRGTDIARVRALRGEFSIRRRAEGGTLIEVNIPLERKPSDQPAPAPVDTSV